MWPFTTPSASSTTWRTGVIALVVQEAAEKMFISSGL